MSHRRVRLRHERCATTEGMCNKRKMITKVLFSCIIIVKFADKWLVVLQNLLPHHVRKRKEETLIKIYTGLFSVFVVEVRI